MTPPAYGLRDFLTLKFDGVEQRSLEIVQRLDAIDHNLTSFDKQMLAHRLRLDTLEAALNDPKRQPLLTVRDGRVLARVGAVAGSLAGTLYWLWGTILPHVPTLPALLAALRGAPRG